MMAAQTIKDLLAQHEFFTGLPAEDLEFIAGCGGNVAFSTGEYVFEEGQAADLFYLLRSGRVALEVKRPDRGPLVVDTAGEGEIVGVSWLFPPYRWQFDARTVEPVRAVALDAVCLRDKCEEDPRLGYELMKRMAEVVQRRMHLARIRLLDLYGAAGTA